MSEIGKTDGLALHLLLMLYYAIAILFSCICHNQYFFIVLPFWLTTKQKSKMREFKRYVSRKAIKFIIYHFEKHEALFAIQTIISGFKVYCSYTNSAISETMNHIFIHLSISLALFSCPIYSPSTSTQTKNIK